ncbi:hypothetical protein [Nitrosomonas sp.]|uniref:hypothetical protein n=1 Tax=Nitrosomonas sp. TaxID=42353 RepID=UPI00263933FB|nr:hypothetical protein [Nitrosomonas sp.]
MKKLVLVFMVVMLASPAFAVEVAPRISDREIIESLAELKAGQKALEAKMDLRFIAMQEQMDQRFTAVDQRFTAMQEQMDQRFEAVDRRLDFIQQLMLITIAGIFGPIPRCARWICACADWRKISNMIWSCNHRKVQN